MVKYQPALVFALFCMLAIGLSACKGKGASINADITGEYALVSVDGNPVPASVSHQGAELQVRSGTLTINADGTCSTRTVFVPPSGSEVTREVAATYTMDGSKVTMNWTGAGTTVGTIQGDTFTMDNEGMPFVYRK